MIYFTSDLHFGHKNVIRFDNRPFTTIEEMDEELIKRWNNKIKDEDTVYILGDISWHKVEKTCDILSKLRGIKFLVKGNHDSIDKSMKRYFKDIYDYKEININGQNIVLCHYPIPCFKNHYSGWIHLYGHTHNTWEEVMNLDKDILIKGNKLYSPNTCCFVPKRLNILFVNTNNKYIIKKITDLYIGKIDDKIIHAIYKNYVLEL